MIGDPLAFWRVCDAAVVLDPLSLVAGSDVKTGRARPLDVFAAVRLAAPTAVKRSGR